MKHKKLWFLGLALMAVLFYTACSSAPEKTLLQKYFHALSMNDNQTMASMAVEPLAIDAVSYKILSASPESVEPFTLPDLNKKEIDTKKAMDEHVAPVVEAKDTLDAAKDDLDNARTAGSRAALKKRWKSFRLNMTRNTMLTRNCRQPIAQPKKLRLKKNR